MLANFQHFSGRTYNYKCEDFPVKNWDFTGVVEALFELLCKNELEKAVSLFSQTSTFFKSGDNEDIKKLYIGKLLLTKSSY